MFELKTIEGEVLIFEDEDAAIEYVISRMIERGIVKVLDRTEDDDLVISLA